MPLVRVWGDAPRKVWDESPRRATPHKKGPMTKKRKLSDTQITVLCCMVVLIATLTAFDVYYAKENRQIEEKYAAEETARQNEINAKLNALKRNTAIKGYIDEYAAEFAVHPAYLAAIVLNESSFRPDATSSVGARGLMQLMPDSGTWIAPKIGIHNYTDDMLYNARTNVHMGAWYVNYLQQIFDGDPVLTACAYHAGANNVKSWLKKYSQDGKTLPIENIPYENSKSYARKVVNAYALYAENCYPDS